MRILAICDNSGTTETSMSRAEMSPCKYVTDISLYLVNTFSWTFLANQWANYSASTDKAQLKALCYCLKCSESSHYLHEHCKESARNPVLPFTSRFVCWTQWRELWFRLKFLLLLFFNKYFIPAEKNQKVLQNKDNSHFGGKNS